MPAQTPPFVATPLTEMGLDQTYQGFSGGLYANGSNVPPPAHAAAGAAHASAIQPLDTDGNPSPTGRIALVSIGMSNTTQEFCSAGGLQPCNPWTFIGQSLPDTDVNHTTLALVNGARGGQDAVTWSDSTDANYDRVRDTDLAAQGLTEAQVQAIWIKEADIGPMSSLPNADADAYNLETYLGDILRAAKIRYTNLQCVFLSSRIYAGYATTTLNPEPYAYESGFAVKWIVQAQIDQMANGGVIVDPRAGDLNYNSGVAPWIAWGPYLWADGTIPRGSDGLIWVQEDFETKDYTHPSTPGEQKVGTLLSSFFQHDPRTRSWFLGLTDTRIAPASGDAAGTSVSVTGAGFESGATLSVGGTAALDVTVSPSEIDATTPLLPAGSLDDVLISNPDGTTGHTQRFLADFSDVSQSNVFHEVVERIFRAAVTSGCGGGNYCVDSPVTRAEMAVFLLKSRFGPFHAPPPATGPSSPMSTPATSPRTGSRSSPRSASPAAAAAATTARATPITRAEIAVFLLKTLLGAAYVPPDPVGIFQDVAPDAFAADFIEDLYNRGIIGRLRHRPSAVLPGSGQPAR